MEKIDLIIYIFLIFILYKIHFIRENYTEEQQNNIKNMILNNYNQDIIAIRNLSNLSNMLTKTGKINVNSNLNISNNIICKSIKPTQLYYQYDTRNKNEKPYWYRGSMYVGEKRTEFKSCNTIKLKKGHGNFCILETYKKWGDTSGGDMHQIALTSNGMAYRSGSTTSWNNWNYYGIIQGKQIQFDSDNIISADTTGIKFNKDINLQNNKIIFSNNSKIYGNGYNNSTPKIPQLRLDGDLNIGNSQTSLWNNTNGALMLVKEAYVNNNAILYDGQGVYIKYGSKSNKYLALCNDGDSSKCGSNDPWASWSSSISNIKNVILKIK